MALSSFDYGVPSILPFKHLLRTQAINETLLWVGKNPAVIRIYSTFPRNCNRSSLLRIRITRRAEPLAPSVFPDDLQVLPQLDPAAVWQKAAKVYAGINHAIASNNRAWINDRIASDFSSV